MSDTASAGTIAAAIILAAGKGTRMKSDRPKVMHEIASRPMLHHVLACAEALGARERIVVRAGDMASIEASALAFSPGTKFAVQGEALGTGHAVRAALAHLEARSGDVVILYGDTPLIRPETIRALQAERTRGADIAVLAFRTKAPGSYGRVVAATRIASMSLKVERIVEAADANVGEREISLCNSGIFLVDGRALPALIEAIGNNNAKGEYYLTDIVSIGGAKGLRTHALETDMGEVLGVNSRGELAAAEAEFQARARKAFMAEGVTLIDPQTVYFAADTKIGRDVEIGPSVYFGPGVTIEDGVSIQAFCHIEGAHVRSGARIGPFARLRPQAEIGSGAHIGNFVEIKKALVEEGAKINHLAYIGDARVGARANIGAGTITCNYDGFDKHFTDIGAGAFVGSNSSLVAPVKIGERSYIGSGSVVTKDVAADDLALTRAPQETREGWAAKFRSRKEREKQRKGDA